MHARVQYSRQQMRGSRRAFSTCHFPCLTAGLCPMAGLDWPLCRSCLDGSAAQLGSQFPKNKKKGEKKENEKEKRTAQRRRVARFWIPKHPVFWPLLPQNISFWYKGLEDCGQGVMDCRCCEKRWQTAFFWAYLPLAGGRAHAGQWGGRMLVPRQG